MSWAKPWPFGAQQVFRRQLEVLEEQLGGVGGVEAELPELAAAAEARRVVGLHHHQRDALGARARIDLGDHDDEVGVLAVGDEGLRAVEHVAVARLPGGGAHALEVEPVPGSLMAMAPTSSPVTSFGASAASAPRCRNAGYRARRCPNAAARRRSKPARLSSRMITASCAKLPPTPPYSSGMAGQSSPAAPALVHTSRSYIPSSHQRSICGANSAAMKRRACSSSSARSSVIQQGGKIERVHGGSRSAANIQAGVRRREASGR